MCSASVCGIVSINYRVLFAIFASTSWFSAATCPRDGSVDCAAVADADTVALLQAVPTKTKKTKHVHKVVYLIRHGEKAHCGKLNTISCLSDLGLERAKYIPSQFGGTLHGGRSTPYPAPDALFSCNYKDWFDCGSPHNPFWKNQTMYRTQQTITPLSEKFGIPINNSYGFMPSLGSNPEAAKAILAKLAEPHINVIVVAWEHNNILYGWPEKVTNYGPGLAESLGASKADLPEWTSDNYDMVFALSYTKDLEYISIEAVAENFNAQPYYINWENPCTTSEAGAEDNMTAED